MSDLRFDPEMRRIAMNDYGARSMWAAIAIILLLVGGLIVAGTYSAGDTQTAQTSPRETTGSASPIPTSPPN